MSLHVLIALNARTSEHAWQGSNRRLFERSVTVAASLATYCADHSYSFALVSNAVAVYTGKWLNIPFSNSDSQIGLVLESLALAGQYAITTLPEVLRAQRDSLPQGTTVALVTALITRPLAEEIAEIKAKGYRVFVFYAGDGGPEIELPDVTVFPLGRALEALDKDDSVLAE